MSNTANLDDSSDKFIVFQMGDELFAASLVEVREVIEHQTPKPIPNMAPYFKGVINIRGEIIGVIDLRERLGIRNGQSPLCQLVFETEAGPLAAIVDRVHSVIVSNLSELERRPSVAQGSDRAYFLGVGKVNETIVTFISLPKIISNESMAVDL
ncbi:MAG: purine-binding chemotaxis protein CheW [Deltaproteobacteria bacterium]|nr:purine-binding chemotaxis protein CheW [Deltaproteobacteria bacterium]